MWNCKLLSNGKGKQEIPREEGNYATMSVYRHEIPFSRGSKEKAVPNDAVIPSPFFNVSKQSIYNYNPDGEKLLVVFAVTVDSKNVQFVILVNA